MPALITDGDLAYLRTLNPDTPIPSITQQQERAIMYYMRGMTPQAASNAAGMAPGAFTRILNHPGIQLLLEYIRAREFQDVRVTRDGITAMFLEAYSRAATAMEMVAATRELAKLHNLYLDSAKPTVTVNINGDGGKVEVNMKKLERMSDEELMALAPDLTHALTAPKPVTIDHE